MAVIDGAPREALEEEQDLYERANLYPRDTGLPMTVWISPRGRARHDARVKVCRTHGDRMTADDTAVVGVRPDPTLKAGKLAAEDLRLVQGWIALNSELLIQYWGGRISTGEFFKALQRP